MEEKEIVKCSTWLGGSFLGTPNIEDCYITEGSANLYIQIGTGFGSNTYKLYQNINELGYSLMGYGVVAIGEYSDTTLAEFIKDKFLVASDRLCNAVMEYKEVKVNDQWYGVSSSSPCRIGIGNDIIFATPPVCGGNFFDWQNKLRYSSGVPVIKENGQWAIEGRQNMKPSKFLLGIRSMYRVLKNGDEIDGTPEADAAFRRYVELRGESFRPLDLSRVKIESIPSVVYGMETEDSTGSLANSCMRKESSYRCSNFAHVYDDMGCKVAYIERDGKLLARALLWETEKWKLMDRVYGSENMIAGFIEWAKINGYGYKKSQDSGSRVFIMPDGLEVDRFKVECELDMDDGSPYMDSFVHYTDGCPGYLSTYTGDYTLQSCEGDAFGNSLDVCEECGAEVGDDDATFVDGDRYCDSCALYDANDNPIRTRDAIELRRSDSRYYAYYHRNECRYVNGAWYHEDDCQECPECSRVLTPDEPVTYIEVTGEDVCDHCIDSYMADNDLELNENNEIVRVEAEVETT